MCRLTTQPITLNLGDNGAGGIGSVGISCRYRYGKVYRRKEEGLPRWSIGCRRIWTLRKVDTLSTQTSRSEVVGLSTRVSSGTLRVTKIVEDPGPVNNPPLEVRRGVRRSRSTTE